MALEMAKVVNRWLSLTQICLNLGSELEVVSLCVFQKLRQLVGSS